MLAFAVDHPAPATIILITGDRDYAYAVSTLKLRKYQVILVVPSPQTSPSLESQASLAIDWGAAVLRTRAEGANSAQAVRQPYPDLDANLVTKLLRELQDPPLADPDATLHSHSTASQSSPELRRTNTRDLLEPSRHSKNTGSFDSTEAFAPTPASPRKSANTGGDPAPGGLPIPKTPSRSRRVSVSAGSARARSTTIVAQSLVVEQDIPADISAKNPTPSSAMRSSASDITDGPAKRSLSVLPPDAVELPFHDNGPPSSIIIRLPLRPGQSTGDMPAPGIPSSKLSCLASPFVMPKVPTELGSTSNSCARQSHTPAKPTLPTVASARILSDTVTSVCQTPQILSSRNVGIDTSGGHVSPPAAIPVYGSVDSAQFATFSRAPDTLDRSAPGTQSVLSSSAFPSTLSTTTGSHEHDQSEQRQTWTTFKPLIHLLLAARESGVTHPSRSTIAVDLAQSDNQVYQRAGVSRFREYTALAEQAGIIELGGREGGAWIALHPNWSAAIRVGSGVDSAQCAAFSRAPDTHDRSSPRSESVLSSSTFPSTPSTTTGSHESERRQAWTMFKPLIHFLLAARESGITHPSRSTIASDLVQSDKQVYQRAGVLRFREYTALAEQVGIIELGGREADAWIALHPNWFGVDGITTTHSLSSRVPSPTPNPPKAIQNPLLTGSKTPLIETTDFRAPTLTSPRSNSPDSCNASPTLLATDQQDSTFRASIPAQFQPLIYILMRMRAEGSYQILRSLVGQLLGQDVYARVGASGFKEYVQQASEAQLVQFGGVGGQAWIRLHPELRI